MSRARLYPGLRREGKKRIRKEFAREFSPAKKVHPLLIIGSVFAAFALILMVVGTIVFVSARAGSNDPAKPAELRELSSSSLSLDCALGGSDLNQPGSKNRWVTLHLTVRGDAGKLGDKNLAIMLLEPGSVGAKELAYVDIEKIALHGVQRISTEVLNPKRGEHFLIIKDGRTGKTECIKKIHIS